MSSLILSPSSLQPRVPGEFLQIDSGTLSIVSDAKEQNLPELLKQLPDLIKTIAASNVEGEQRLHLHDRLVHFGAEVAEHNKAIDESLCVTILHVILLILTFGGFSYRDSLRLEEPAKVSLASLFPVGCEWKPFAETYTVEQFRALPEELRGELSLLIGLGNENVHQLMTETYEKGTTLTDVFDFDESDTRSSSRSSTPSSEKEKEETISLVNALQNLQRAEGEPDLEELKTALTGLSGAQIGEQLASEEAILDSNLRYVATALTKEQWIGLPKAAFFLLLSSAHKVVQVPSSISWMTLPPRKEAVPLAISSLDLGNCYLQHDPSLEKLTALVLEKGDWLLGLLLGPRDQQGLAVASSLTKAISLLPAASMEQLLKTSIGASLHSAISEKQLSGFSFYLVLSLACSKTHAETFAPFLKSGLAAVSLEDWTENLTLENLQNIGEPTGSLALSGAVALMPESIWNQIAWPTFSLLAYATRVKAEIPMQISAEAFRRRYLQLDPEWSHLPYLILDKRMGAGAPLLKLLMPLEPAVRKNLLSALRKESEWIRGEERKGGNHPLCEIATLLSKSLSSEEILALEPDEFDTLTGLWYPGQDRPLPSDKNFRTWLEQLIAKGKGEELALVTAPHPSEIENASRAFRDTLIATQQRQGWFELLDGSDTNFLWSLLLAIPYSGLGEDELRAELRTREYGRGKVPPHLSWRAIGQTKQDRNPSIARLCGLIPTGKWNEMIASADSLRLAWFFQGKRLSESGDSAQARVDALLGKLAEKELPDDLELLSSLTSGLTLYSAKGAEPLAQKAKEKYLALFAASLAQPEAFAKNAATLSKPLLKEILTSHADTFIPLAAAADYKTQKKILRQLEVPNSDTKGKTVDAAKSPSHALLAAIQKTNPNLANIWKAMNNWDMRSEEWNNRFDTYTKQEDE